MSELDDSERWRQLAVAANDLDVLTAAARPLRDELDGRNLERTLRALSALAEGSHALARLVQADLEAVLVVREAGEPVPEETMALFPAVPGAVRASRGADGGWVLDGVQPRTVHPAAVGRALVVADTEEGPRLFSFAVADPGAVRDRVPLRLIAPENPNGPMTFTGVRAQPVGTAQWWNTRAESWAGLLRDAACWFGSCLWLCRAVESTLAARTDGADLERIGRVDVWVFSARLAVRHAAPVVEADPTGAQAELAARRAAAVMATTADTVIRLIALLSDRRVSKENAELPHRVAQLQIALQRFDGAANLRALGVLVAAETATRGGPD